ncbi:hypothetical protein BG000_009574, partial [Podila horticola]
FASTTQESCYLADLVQQLSLPASQFGLVLASVLEAVDENGSPGINFPSQNIDEEPEGLQPHFRSSPLPRPSFPQGTSEPTEINIAIQGHAHCIVAHCEKEMMQAAINAAESSISTDNATGENMLQALKKQPDSVIAGHYDNIGAIIFTVLECKAKTFKPKLNQDDTTL